MSIRNTVRSALSRPVHSDTSWGGPLGAVTRRPIALVLPALLLLAMLAGTVAWNVTGKTVALSVDGAMSEVDFRGSTVADALAAADLRVGEHDQIVPAVDSTIGDGDRVALRRGRPVELVVDGERRTVWVTAASVDEALDQLGLREQGLALSASRSRSIPLDGLSLDVRTPKDVTVTVDGASTPLTSSAWSVTEALTGAGVQVGPLDRVTPAADVPLYEGMGITVQRVATSEVVETAAVDFPVEKRDDADLTEGSTKVLQAGEQGELSRTFQVTTVDGVVEGRRLVSETRTAEPVARVVAVGTKPEPAPAPEAAPASSGSSGPRQSTGGADGLNWPALAQCESGGNPRATNPSGKYRGLYQFSIQTWRGVGGSGDPAAASAGEQTYRAKLLYNRSGAGQWPQCGRRLFS